MKVKWMTIVLTAVIGLSGCSFLEEVNGTIDYVNQATDYVNEATEFANEVPAMAEQAITDTQALADLETRLLEMKQEIEAFNELEAPNLAEDLHQQVMEQNNRALEGINVFLSNIENGELDSALLENTELFTTLQELTELSNQIQQLGE
ncbi:DUF6376 family protein [Robertmurraya korlensis]|uniref:DUF6376 family protein n=1 Tax=Robertmurraya korlensis TaxID=519977 RepID=UPI000825173B|nr:DUF6376 family protein [Robertmurraya korlensis]